MNSGEVLRSRQQVIDEFNAHEGRNDGVQVADSLSNGLTLLCDAFYARVHDDVERRIGMDSMLMPASREKSEKVARLEIEIYLAAVSAVHAAEWKCVKSPDGEWYSRWLCRLRLGSLGEEAKVLKRLDHYRGQSPDGRRLAFSDVLTRAWPESRRAPLVLFRLAPLAVRVVTATAFSDLSHATQARQQQCELLPSIRDCGECHGQLLENGKQCPSCGNPLWKYDWLVAAD
jgi:hypothetical protein